MVNTTSFLNSLNPYSRSRVIRRACNIALTALKDSKPAPQMMSERMRGKGAQLVLREVLAWDGFDVGRLSDKGIPWYKNAEVIFLLEQLALTHNEAREEHREYVKDETGQSVAQNFFGRVKAKTKAKKAPNPSDARLDSIVAGMSQSDFDSLMQAMKNLKKKAS